jgi:predicted small lipoprotein YifL
MNNTVRWFASFVLLLSAGSLIGCGSAPPPPLPPAAPTALSLDEWRTMTAIEEKYDGATLDRLRMADPRLRDNRQWQAFMNQHVIPERAKDIPTAPGQQPP